MVTLSHRHKALLHLHFDQMQSQVALGQIQESVDRMTGQLEPLELIKLGENVKQADQFNAFAHQNAARVLQLYRQKPEVVEPECVAHWRYITVLHRLILSHQLVDDLSLVRRPLECFAPR